MQILPLRQFARQFIDIGLDQLVLFGIRVDLAGCQTRHQIILSGCDKLLLEDIDHVHRCHDVGDIAMHLQACRLVARSLADDDGLDEVTHDRHQPLFDRFVGVVAREEDEFADPNLDVCRVELGLQLLDLPLKIHCRLLDCR
ncbi:hypothetical protein [Rhizobium rosettiformans]|uniref:hypothetical protein n=1 Tax=Rhizobium rosettiformans TaxID=1368430 RepID=UPI00286C97F3|nr:hypothetical protein [Rhizobium rosettiformans]